MPGRIPDAVKRVFTETFSAQDIAEPMASFDAEAPAPAVRAFMEARHFDVVGIRRAGQMESYVELSALQEGPCGQFSQEFGEKPILDENAPLLRVMMELDRLPYVFVTVLGKVGGIITRADLLKPPVRMWLFGIVTMIEMRFGELIDRHYPAEAWKQFLSEGRLQKAQALLEERRRRNQSLQLLDCLQFSDKGQIIARNEEVRKFTIFPSRRAAEDAVKQLEQLRNNLAHAQDILQSDWSTIVRLCEFLQRQLS